MNSPFAPCPEQGITMRCQLPERAAPLILLMPDVCRYLLLYAFPIDQGLPFDVTQQIWIILLCVVCHKDGIPIKGFF